MPEYNFRLLFDGKKVAITKDGAKLDVYGSGVYSEQSDWYVPGYENFMISEDAARVQVEFLIRAEPIQYSQSNADGHTVTSFGDFYYLARSGIESRQFYTACALSLAVGLALLGLCALLRQEKKLLDRRIAKLTRHVWTEVRVLAVLGSLWWLMMGSAWVMGTIYVGAAAEYTSVGAMPAVGSARVGQFAGTLWQAGAGLLANIPAVLALFWTLWLIGNDHRYTPKEERRSLLQAISARSLPLPFQQRICRWNRAALVFSCLPVAIILFLSWAWGIGFDQEAMVLLPAVLSTLVLFVALRQSSGSIWDVSQLVEQVSAVHNGELSAALQLSQDSDLRVAAEQLNDIQSGMRAALAEQTHSERMKVALISNVSHDLKTPLTSILSYAELLRQEELSDTAADYARIIEEKAKRLSAMVQDVFDVSKAASNQLPVQLEPLDFGKLLRQTLADMEDPIRQSALVFKIDLPETPMMIVGDGKRLYRVFQNLIQNTLRYALEGTRVHLSLTQEQGCAVAALRNTSRNELPEGMDFTARFVRGDESRTSSGSGLGLSIVSSFTEACGGEFRVETVADLFTAVVSFPFAKKDQ